MSRRVVIDLYNLWPKCHAHVMDAATSLLEIEAIKQLKARYCRFLDTKDWQAWRGIFADDFHSDTSESGGTVIDGADEFVAFVRKNLKKQPTVHQVHAPEIELTSPTTARGVWALNDVVRLAPGLNLDGFGHYHETYEKTDGQWRHHEFQTDPSSHRHLQSAVLRAYFGPNEPDGSKAGTPLRRLHISLSKHFSSTRLLIRHPSAVRMNSSTYQMPTNRICFSSTLKTIGLKQMVREEALSPAGS